MDIESLERRCAETPGDERNYAIPVTEVRELVRANLALRKALVTVIAHDGPGFPHGTCADIAAAALNPDSTPKD